MVAKIEKGLTKNLKSVGDVYEAKDLSTGPGYRIYFQYDGKKIVLLLLGGIKRTQKEDIKEANKLWSDYKKKIGAKKSI